MCKSLPFGALAFDLYSACPFESLPVVPATGLAVTAPLPVVPVEAQTLVRHNGVQPLHYPDYYAIRDDGGFDRSVFLDFDHGAFMDAPEFVASGSHRAGHICCAGTTSAFFFTMGAVCRG